LTVGCDLWPSRRIGSSVERAVRSCGFEAGCDEVVVVRSAGDAVVLTGGDAQPQMASTAELRPLYAPERLISAIYVAFGVRRRLHAKPAGIVPR
jgi:hypothetical protein